VAGKKVAVIGNGASAIQVLTQLQKTAAQLTNYIRSPTWIFSNHAAELTKDGTNFEFTEEEKKGFRENPDLLLKLRNEIERRYVNNFGSCIVTLFLSRGNLNLVKTNSSKFSSSIRQLKKPLLRGHMHRCESDSEMIKSYATS
jgi:hypothetical protein